MANGEDNSKRLPKVCRRIDELKASALNYPICAEKVQDAVSKALRATQEDHSIEREEQFFYDEKMIGSQIAEDDRYSTLIKTAFESIAISVDGIIVEVHEDFARANGYELSELIGRHVIDFLVLEEHELAIQTLSSSEERMGEYSALKKDGSTFAVEAHGRIIEQDGKPVRVTVIRDITERKRAEEALRESQKKYQALIETTGDFVWETDSQGRFTYCSPQLEKLWGLKPEETIGKISFDMMPEDYKECIKKYFLNLTVSPGPFTGLEANAYDGRGGLIFTETSGVPFFDDNGRLLGFRGISRDITERKKAEMELRRSRDELELRVLERTADLVKAKETAEAAVEAKAAFLANMSHELRTPMNAVIGFSSLLLDEPLSPDHRDYIERIRASGEALLTLINDILDFSKMEKKKTIINLSPLSIRTLLEESMDMVAVQAGKKDLKLSYTIGYGTPDAIIGDNGRLRQILVNLLSNAVKFTDAGEVSVSVFSREIGGGKHRFSFAVMDTGIGIPPDKMGILFQPFSRVDTTMSSRYDGSGLGLAISKSLIELMCGQIWADSEEGRGSTFHFSIDSEIVQDLSSRSVTSAKLFYNMAEGHPLRILVAEDNPSNQKVMVEMLKRMGYWPDAVADGREVIESLERRPYDIVFMDVRMPEMDGLKATQEIRKRWPINGPKVIAITAYALSGDREKCLEAGMDDYIAKPVQKGELAGILKRYALEIQ
jgi:PAS domain S-box-containing protein